MATLDADLAATEAAKELASLRSRAMSETDLNYLKQAELAAANQPDLQRRHDVAKARHVELAETLDTKNGEYTDAVLINEAKVTRALSGEA